MFEGFFSGVGSAGDIAWIALVSMKPLLYLIPVVLPLMYIFMFNHVVLLINSVGSGNIGKILFCKKKVVIDPETKEKLHYLTTITGKHQLFYADSKARIPTNIFFFINVTFIPYRGGVNGENIEIHYIENPGWFTRMFSKNTKHTLSVHDAREILVQDQEQAAYLKVKPIETSILLRNERENIRKLYDNKPGWWQEYGQYVVPVAMVAVFLITIIVSYNFYAKAAGGG